MALLNQDLKDVDQNDAGGSWRALPPGEYVCEIIESEVNEALELLKPVLHEDELRRSGLRSTIV